MAENPDAEWVRELKEFDEMFVNNHNHQRIYDIAKSVDVGPLIALEGSHVRKTNIYQSWKSGYTPSAESLARKDDCSVM